MIRGLATDGIHFNTGCELLCTVPVVGYVSIADLAADFKMNVLNVKERLNAAALKCGIWLRYRGNGKAREVGCEPASAGRLLVTCESYWQKVYRE